MESLKEVIINNQNLIYSIINKFNVKQTDDLFQAGCVGMIEAYKTFDENRNVKFTTYAYPFILGRISEYVRENHLIKMSKEMTATRKKILKIKSYLTQELMREPTINELSDYLNIPVSNIEKMLNYDDCLSLDESYDDKSLYDIMQAKNINYNDLIYLKDYLKNLKEPEKTIMFERYFKDKTQSEVASDLGLSQVDISRKENKVLVRLRQTIN